MIGFAIALILLSPLLRSTQQTEDTDNLRSYIACPFGDKYQVEESVERSQPFMRPVVTPNGENVVEVLHGWSLHIAYDHTPFVNFKAERLGKSNYLRDKKTLISNLEDAAIHTAGMQTTKPGGAAWNGLEVYSINRTQLEGGVLSIYLLFRDSDRVVVTLYLLNTPPEVPKFKTIEEYYAVRDGFLNSYAACISKHTKQ